MANLTDIRSSWSTGASEGGVTVYATKENLPTSGLTSGDQAYVTNTSRLYISNGSGWYNVALINATPSLTISPAGSIELSTAGATTTITLTATDSDNSVAGLTFSVDSDGSFGGLGTISQDSSVFTITPFSEDSATTSLSTLTFKASDGISFGSGQSAISLTFSILNSKFTQLLLQADTAGTDNQVDASSNAQTITEVGNITSSAWTPYHPGGYSNYMTASGNGYVEWASPPTFSATAWCVETWFKADGMPSVAVGTTGHWSIFGCWTANTNAKEFLILGGSSGELRFYYSFNGSSASYIDSTSGKFSANTWVHLALSFDGTNYTLYADGVNVARVTNSTQIANTNAPLSFGKSVDGAGATQTYVNGWYADGRVINGSTLESNNTFPVPTSRIDTSVANTQAVFHNKPHVRQSLTYGGDATIKRDGPYNYMPYTKSAYGGSVYFDGSGDWLTIPNASEQLVPESGDFTVEFWFHTTNASTRMDPYSSYTASTGFGIILNYTNVGGVISTYNGNTVTNTTGSGKFKANVWNHLAVSRSGSSLKIFINGEAVYTNASDSTDYSGTASLYIGAAGNQSLEFSGSIADVRFVKGTAVYTTNFLAPTSPLTAISGTQLLTLTNKNNIWDASGQTFILDKRGDVTASNTQRKFTSSSAIKFDGTGDYLRVEEWFDTFSAVTDPCTIEGFIYSNVDPGTFETIFAMNRNSNGNNQLILGVEDGEWSIHYSGNSQYKGGSFSANTWYHFAIVLNDGTSNKIEIYINGTTIYGNTDALDAAPSACTIAFGTEFDAASGGTPGNYFDGYMQDLRVSNYARYTGNFTPSTTESKG